jgi:uncharacterized SAM-binding protein YcdF (DUF218 family)
VYSLASYIFWSIVEPSRLFPAMAILGALLLWTPWRRAGRWLATIAALAIFLIGASPLARWIAEPLEYRFSALAPDTEDVAGVVVLGAGYAVTSALTGMPVVEASGGRLVKLIELAQRYPGARLAYSGGGPPTLAMSEADRAARDLAHVGFDVGRITFEGRSRNSYQNAILTKELMTPRPDERWIIVTSAIHMPRAVGAFRAAGWNVVAAPVEYLFPKGVVYRWGFDPVRRFPHASRVVHEWIGLVAYRVLGRSNELFPRP